MYDKLVSKVNNIDSGFVLKTQYNTRKYLIALLKNRL